MQMTGQVECKWVGKSVQLPTPWWVAYGLLLNELACVFRGVFIADEFLL